MITTIADPWTTTGSDNAPVSGWTKKTKKTGTFSGVTHVTLVLDKSGSMGMVAAEVVTGVNAWLTELRKSEGSFPTTIVLFDTVVETPVLATPVAEVNDLTADRYRPGGFTALNDAVVRAVHATEERVRPGDRALVCVVTDGQENSSREYPAAGGGTARVRALIQDKEAGGNWTFTYLSAHPDAFADAKGYGINPGNTMVFAASAGETSRAFTTMASSTHAYVGGATGQSTSFFAPDPADATDADTDVETTGDAP